MRNPTRKLAFGLLVIVTLSGLIPLTFAGPALKPSGAPEAIAISTIPSELPADNNTYPAVVVSVVDSNHQPTVALSSLDIFLTSSQENVGKVTSALQIAKGQTYAIANFTTTSHSGSTFITATTSGLTTATATVTTVVAVGYPTRLVITAVPGVVPAKAANTGKLFMELEDNVGLPAKAISDTPVTVYSSNTQVINVTVLSTIIAQGQYLKEINYTSGFVPGSAVITASAAGFDSGVTSITVQGSPPLALKVFAEPSVMVACASDVTSCTGRLVIALTDPSGNPTTASSDIQVQIRSSDLGVVNTVETATIPAGSISTNATYTVTSTPGLTTMSASAPGLQSGFASITTIAESYVSPGACTSGNFTCQLAVYAGPDPVLANHQSYSSVVVALESGPGLPAINITGPTKVALTSSVTGVGNFSSVIFSIPKGQNWAAITFTSTYQVGQTQLTASGQNLLPVQTTLSTFGPVPSQVVVTPISSTLPADGASHPALELSLEDAFGSPALAPFDVPVSLSSSQGDIVKVGPVIIPIGQTYAVVNATAGIVPGTANVTALQSAFSSGYATSSALITTVLPSPSALSAFAANNGELISTVKTTLPLLAVQLQDSTGVPARARAPMNITLTSSNSTVLQQTLTASIDIGGDYATVPISPLVPGTTTLTISAPGLASSSLAVTFLPDPVQVTISGGPTTVLTNQTAIVSASVLIDGTPFSGANVVWSTSSGGLTLVPKASNASTSSSTLAAASTASSKSSTRASARAQVATSTSFNDTTGKDGSSTVIYHPTKAGTAIITAVVSEAGLATTSLNFTITASGPAQGAIAKTKSSLPQELTSFPLVLAPIGGAGGAAAAVFVLRRRKGRGSAGVDEDFDNSLQ